MTHDCPSDFFPLPVPAPRDSRQRLGRAMAACSDPGYPGNPPTGALPPNTVLLSLFFLRELWHEEPDSALYFDGSRDSFPPFEAPAAGQRTSERPLSREDSSHLSRLLRFAHLNRPIEWMEDPRRPQWEALLASLEQGEPDAPVPGDTQELWDMMLAVARADRFSDGEFYLHRIAMTRIANELRRRLLGVEATSRE